MLRILFDNLVLVAVSFGSFTAGVFLSSQWLKDKLSGVPSELRKALTESEALAKRAVANFAATKAVSATVAPVVARPVIPPAPAPVAVDAAPPAAPAPSVQA